MTPAKKSEPVIEATAEDIDEAPSGAALVALVGEDETIDVPLTGGRGVQPVPRRRIAEIAWERAQLADESTKLRDELKTDADRAK